MKSKIYTAKIDFELNDNDESITPCPHGKKCGRKVIMVASADCERCEDNLEHLGLAISKEHVTCSEVPYSAAMITAQVGAH
jgi:hypothetical protein